MRWLVIPMAILLTTLVQAGAAWQFAVPTQTANGKPATAYLWVPPQAERMRGLLIGQPCYLEEDPVIREACAAAGLGIVVINPGIDATFQYGTNDCAKLLQQALNDLAAASGYREVAVAPLLPFGRSTSGIFARNVAYWNPRRTIAVLYMKSGQIGPPAFDKTASLAGVPFVAMNGQFEEFGPGPSGVLGPDESGETQWRGVRDTLVALRTADDRHLVSCVVDAGAGHFTCSAALRRYMALYIRKAAQARIPDWPVDQREPVVCTEIDPASGWLTDNRITTPARFPAAPYRAYQGNPREAMWHFDEELARATEAFHATFPPVDQMVTFTQGGTAIAPSPRITLRYEPVGDGQSFKVAGTFLAAYPEKRPHAGELLGHADGPIQFALITGPAVQTGPDTFRIQAMSYGFPNPIRLIAYHPGDGTYRYCEMPAAINLPTPTGTPQTITFPEIAPLHPGDTVALAATSDAGLPVEYYVAYGPAVIEHGRLTVTDLPPRTAYPVPIKVVAYQWGRLTAPGIAAAPMVERTVLVTR